MFTNPLRLLLLALSLSATGILLAAFISGVAPPAWSFVLWSIGPYLAIAIAARFLHSRPAQIPLLIATIAIATPVPASSNQQSDYTR